MSVTGVRFLVVGTLLSPCASGQTSPQASPSSTGWRQETSRSRMDDSQTVTLKRSAAEAITVWPAKTFVPILVLRCKERETDAYVITGAAANPELGRHAEASVMLRFDSAPAERLQASESTDNQALFLPDPIRTIHTMLKSKRLVFRFTPFNSTPQETVFDLSGLSSVAGPLRKACGWDEATEAAQRSAQQAARDKEIGQSATNLDSPDHYERYKAAAELTLFGGPLPANVMKRLAELISDFHETVRLSSLTALRQAPDSITPECVLVIAMALEAENARTRAGAADLLKTIGPKASPVREKLQDAANRETDPDTKALMLRALSEVPPVRK